MLWTTPELIMSNVYWLFSSCFRVIYYFYHQLITNLIELSEGKNHLSQFAVKMSF